MNQNKIIIYSLVGLIVMGLGWIFYFLTSAPKNTAPATTLTPAEVEASDFYFISLTELSGNIYSKAMVGDKTIDLDQGNINQYVIVGFTNTNERLGVICPNERYIKNAVSPTNNNVAIEIGDTSASMNLNKGQQNSISFICSKTPPN